jgi:hypothetical protein
MLLALILQTVSMLSPYGVALRTDETAHYVVHTQNTDHHHHDDLSVHFEDTMAADSHQHTPSGLQSFGLISTAFAQASIAPSLVPSFGNLPLYVQPWIDGWLRPPRNLA